MNDHQTLLALAHETLDILQSGAYSFEGHHISLPDLQSMIEGTTVYSPADEVQLLAELESRRGRHSTLVEVTGEDTFAAALRLQRQFGRVAALNFANATTPGGGFLRGARAQEEDLCRCSTLYASLVSPQAEPYYLANDAEDSPLYTDHLIYSPKVAVFRARGTGVLPAPVPVDVITAPAPYVCWMKEVGETALRAQLYEVLTRRARLVLAVAASQGIEHLVLGAWGCGAFCNDPEQVAGIFKKLLTTEATGVFKNVIFAVYDAQPGQPNLQTFEEVLGSVGGE